MFSAVVLGYVAYTQCAQPHNCTGLQSKLRMSARLAPSSRPLPLLFVAFLSLFVCPRPSPPWVINVIIKPTSLAYKKRTTPWPGDLGINLKAYKPTSLQAYGVNRVLPRR